SSGLGAYHLRQIDSIAKRGQAFLRGAVLENTWLERWIAQDTAVAQLLDDGDVLLRDLADVEGVERHALLQQREQLDQSAQVDEVAGESARLVYAHRDLPCSAHRVAVLVAQQPERVDEGCAVLDGACGDDACREESHAVAVEAAGQVRGEHGEAFLQLVVARESEGELLERLRASVHVGEHVRADLVMDEWRDASRIELQVLPDQQVAARDEQPAHI